MHYKLCDFYAVYCLYSFTYFFHNAEDFMYLTCNIFSIIIVNNLI